MVRIENVRPLALAGFLFLAACGGSSAPPEYDFSAVDAAVEDFLASERGAGLEGSGLIIVHRDHGVVHERAFGAFEEDRVYLVASSSKMVTAGVLNRLQDDGLLDLDAPISDVVAWGDEHPGITAAQLVSNSSGLKGLDPQYGPHLCQFIWSGQTLQSCAELIYTAPQNADVTIPPDTSFRYGGAQWQVAGAVAEVASGKSWAELVDEIYVEPCGLQSFGFNNHFVQYPTGGGVLGYPIGFDGDPETLEPTENPNMEGGLYTSVRDYGELLLMHLRGGTCGGNRVLSEESVWRMQEDRIQQVYDGSAGRGQGYGMGWWVSRDRPGWVSDGGAYGSFPWIDNERGYAAFSVIEGNSGVGSQLAFDILDEIEAAIDSAG